jgi:hypothetical protein
MDGGALRGEQPWCRVPSHLSLSNYLAVGLVLVSGRALRIAVLDDDHRSLRDVGRFSGSCANRSRFGGFGFVAPKGLSRPRLC